MEVEIRSPVKHSYSEADSGVARGRSKEPEGSGDEREVEDADLGTKPSY